MTRASCLCLLLAAGGCATPRYATVDGKRVERPSVGYGSDYFRLEHERLFPGIFDPRRGLDVSDGTLDGQICGVEVHFDASWYRARLHLDGRGWIGPEAEWTGAAPGFRLDFEVTEEGSGRRHIWGRVPVNNMLQSAELDLEVQPDRLVGRIGMRQFDLFADGEYLAGRYQRHGDVERPLDEKYAIYGRQILAGMVPADQALVLLMMMTCTTTVDYHGKMVRGFSMVSLPPAAER